MRAIESGAARALRGLDLYESAEQAVHALVHHVYLPRRIAEPCAGRGRISRILRANGHYVMATDVVLHDGADADIRGGCDFFATQRAPLNIDTIVTNPPYMMFDKFMRHALFVWRCRTIVLAPYRYCEGTKRSDYVDAHLRHVWLGRDRLPMMHREGWQGPKIGKSGIPYAWFDFDPKPKAAASTFGVTRISWGDFADVGDAA